jgi:uncharacterized protein
MCILCRDRLPQQSLLRLQCLDRNLTRFTGSGRSFYLCPACFEQKKLDRALARQCKTGETQKLLNQLKEIIADDR